MMDEVPEIPVVSDVSPLRAFLTEAHEIYTELLNVGFPKEAATSIVAVMIGEAIESRGESGFDIEAVDDFDEDDIDDDNFDGAG
jgi:hypothetical protein